MLFTSLGMWLFSFWQCHTLEKATQHSTADAQIWIKEVCYSILWSVLYFCSPNIWLFFVQQNKTKQKSNLNDLIYSVHYFAINITSSERILQMKLFLAVFHNFKFWLLKVSVSQILKKKRLITPRKQLFRQLYLYFSPLCSRDLT